MPRSRSIVLAIVGPSLVLSALLAACVGDEAPVTNVTNDEGGTPTPPGEGGNPTPPEMDGSQPPGDGATPTDAGGDAATEAGFDAGAPIWTATMPAGTPTEGPTTTDFKCRFSLLYVNVGGLPPKYAVVLRKDDEPGQTCNEPKGFRQLDTSYSVPSLHLLKAQTSNRIVISWTAKISQSGSSPTELHIRQVDWASGNDMHDAFMKTKDVQGMPVIPALTVSSMFFGDATEEAVGTIRVDGSGSFPGATGSGPNFKAVWMKFIGGASQPGSAADTATQVP